MPIQAAPTPSAPPTPPLPPTGNPPTPSSCGGRPSSGARIVGGHETVKNSIPWQAMLRTDGGQFCGGSLIHKRYVLTAAHCVDGSSADSFKIWYSLSYLPFCLVCYIQLCCFIFISRKTEKLFSARLCLNFPVLYFIVMLNNFHRSVLSLFNHQIKLNI